MGVELYQLRFPTDECKFHKHHYFTKVLGNVWRCKYCWASKFLPSSFEEAMTFTLEIKRKGLSTAYKNQLKERPNTIKMLETLRGIKLARKETDEETAKRLEQKLILTLVKDKREITALRKEMNFGYNKEGAISILDRLDKTSAWDVKSAGRKVSIMKGRS